MKMRLRWPKIPVGETYRVLRRFAPVLRPYRAAMSAGGLCVLGSALIELARPWPLKIIFDYILIPSKHAFGSDMLGFLQSLDTTSILLIAAAAILLISIVSGLLHYGQRIILGGVGHKLVGAVRLQLFTHIQRLPQSYHDHRETGDLLMRMTGDLNLVKDLLISILVNLGSRGVIVLGMLAAMAVLDPLLTLITLAVIPILLLINTHFSTQIKEASRRQRRKEGQLATSVHDSITSISLIKSFAQEDRQARRIGKQVSSDVEAGLRIRRLEAAFSRSVDIVTALGLCGVIWFGVQRVLDGAITAGDLLIFTSYMRGVYRPVRDLAELSTRTSKAVVSAQRIIDVLDQEAPVTDLPDAISARDIRGDIRFEDVGFEYYKDHSILRSLTFRIPGGRTTAIVGPSGAGKSTIAKLILRLYEPAHGRIVLDDRDIRGYQTRSLRKRITSLSQDITMFHTTVRENIAFARPDASPEEIEDAARRAGAAEFIEGLRDGYETVVGEGGLTVSGGQRQRLAFARAALRDSPIMIFDEPATGLDAQAERAAKQSLATLREGRTTIIITHRLNFLDLADHVVLLGDGRVLEEGDPAVLIQRAGPYQDFVRDWSSMMALAENGDAGEKAARC